jgi:hypothetical protein
MRVAGWRREQNMPVLVTWRFKCGGTEGIARIIANELKALGVEAAVIPDIRLSRPARLLCRYRLRRPLGELVAP